MNKIFKVIWNYATQSWVAVSELQKAKGKTKSLSLGADVAHQSFPILKFSLISSGLLLASSQVMAATGTDNTAAGQCYYDPAPGNSVICGNNNTKNSKTFATSGATATGQQVVAIGANAEALNLQDIAIGFNAGKDRADQGSGFAGKGNVYSGGALSTGVATIATSNGISIGNAAGWNSSGENNISIGRQSSRLHYGEDSITIGRDANNYAMHGFSDGTTVNNTIDALKNNTKNNTTAVNRSRYSVAIGRNAMTYDDSSISIGDGAKSIRNDSIAIGTGARAGMSYKTVGDIAQTDSSIAIGKGSTAPLGGDLSIGINTGSTVNQNTQTKVNMQNTKNVSVGNQAGNNVYGWQNMVFGVSSGNNIGTATAPNYANTAMGYDVGNNIRGDNNVNVGYQSGKNIMSNSNTGVGSRTAVNINGANNAVVGYGAGNNIRGSGNLALGQSAGNFVGTLNGTQLNITTGKFMSGSTETVDRFSSNNISGGQNAGNYVYGNGNIAFGQNAGKNVGHRTTAFGAQSSHNVALGENAGQYIDGNYNLALGSGAGKGTESDVLVRTNSISQGRNAMAYTNDSIAIGTGSVAGVQSANGAGKVNAIAIGNGAQATGIQSISVGTGNVVSGDYSGAFGDPTTITGTGSYSIGNNNKVATDDTFTIGSNITSTADNSVFLGKEAAYIEQGGTTDGLGAVTEPVTVGGTLTYEGFAGKTPVGVVSVGDVGKERRIQNVAAGLISASSTDAINGSQLYATNKTLDNLATSTKNILGGNAALAPNGTITMTNIGNTGKNNVHDAIAAAITEVKAGTNIASVVKTAGDDGHPIYTVNADGASVSSGNANYVTVTPGTKDANNMTDYAVDLSQGAKDSLAKADTAVQTIVAQVNGTEVKTLNQTDNSINFVNGNATTARADGQNITFDVVTDNDTIKIDNGKIAANTTMLNVSNGKVDTPTSPNALVNAQSVADAINDSGFNIIGSGNGSGFNNELINPGETITLDAGKNMVLTQIGNKFSFATADDVSFNSVTANTIKAGDTTINTDGLTINNGPSITKNGINAGNQKITNVADGEISANSKEAVNGSQLYTVAQNVTNNTNAINTLANNTIKLGGNSGTTEAQALNKEGGLQFNVKGENGLTTAASGTDVTVTIAQSNISTNNNGTVSADMKGNAYATAEQVSNAINSAGFTLKTSADGGAKLSGTDELITPGKTVEMIAGKNLTVTQTADGKVAFATADDVTFNNVTANTIKAGDTTINTNGLTIQGGPSVTKDGINAANKVITNVAAGVADTDAVNVSQLKAAQAAATTTVKGDQGVTVTLEENKDGSKAYNVAAKTDGTTITVDKSGNISAITTDLTHETTGKVATPSNPNALVNAQSVADAINNSGFNIIGAGNGSGFANELVNPGETITLEAGKNMVLTQTGGQFSFATANDVTFNTVTANTIKAGDTTINTNGLTIQGGPSVTKDGINAANKVITNVAAGTADTDAVNVSQLKAVQAAATTTVKGNQGVTVTLEENKDGSKTYNVAAKTDGTTIKIDASGNIAANTGTITAAPVNVTDTSGNVLPNAGKVTVANGEGSKVATVQNVADAINSAGWVVNTGKAADQTAFTTEPGTAKKVSAGDKVNFQAGKNMEVKRDGDNIIYATSDNVSFNSVNVGNTNITTNGITINNGPSMTTDGINAGGQVISNVKAGKEDSDAVNVSQLKGAVNNINSQLNKMDKRRKAGHASGLAVAGLMQAYREGQSAVTAGVGQYQNQSAVAVGYSRIADSGKYGVKAAFTANTQGEVGGTLSAGYFW